MKIKRVIMNDRAGYLVEQSGGYRAFIPKPLPPNPPLAMDDELIDLLSRANLSIARFDGLTANLPNRDLFVAMFVKKEALMSSQIEGTQASLEGVLEFEANMIPRDDIDDVVEVVNYVKAMNYGIERLEEFPMSLRLIREIHEILLQGARGKDKNPGEFRTTQNWIGPKGATLKDAFYVPPPHIEAKEAMGELEKFIHKEDNTPDLIKAALIHSQFETIHPFLDGNGRVGRLLIIFYLVWKGVLSQPLLYLSYFLKMNQSEYYDRLTRIRTNGDFEGWVKFVLKGIIETSTEQVKTANEIIALREGLLKQLYREANGSIYNIRLVDLLFVKPIISTKAIVEEFGITKETANQLIRKFETDGIIKEITGKKRYMKFVFSKYVEIIGRGTQIHEGGF